MHYITNCLANSCSQYSERNALYCYDETITYQQLAIRVETIAQLIKKQGISNQRVLIYLPKSIDYVVAIYAVLASGNIYVPIDASQPLERAKLILTEAHPALVITQQRLKSNYVCNNNVLEIDKVKYDESSWTPQLLKSAMAAWHTPKDNDIAAILFTSGSTGIPKGVNISHIMLNNFIEWTINDLALTYKDVFSNHASYAFDLSTFDLFASSRVGGAMWIITQEQQHNVNELLKGLERFKVTIWYSVPTVLSMLTASGELSLKKTKQLRHVLFAGEPYPIGAIKKLCQCLPSHCNLSNWYGPTETNVCLAYRFSPQNIDFDSLSTLAIGRPITGFKLKLFNEQDLLVTKPEELGELVVEGVGVTPGYCNVTDSHNKENHHHKRHATGDLVRFDQNGLYYYQGRIDDLVKINGHRIELGEIETCLGSMPGIKNVAVVAKLDEEQHRLVAHIVPENEQPSLNIITVKQFVSERLPRYMVPNAIRFLSSLPTNANGKIDRKHLKSME